MSHMALAELQAEHGQITRNAFADFFCFFQTIAKGMTEAGCMAYAWRQFL